MDSLINDIYQRQKDLLKAFKFYEKSALIIGAGGIGSWIALNLALIGVGTLIIIDPDTVEHSNLNRTLFRLSDIGRNKAEVIKELISERRSDVITISVKKYFSIDHLKVYNVDYIFDCTDTLSVRNKFKSLDFIGEYVKVGYDGFYASISINDFESGSWGEDGSYTTVPSFFGTPQVISALVITEILINNKFEVKTINFTTDKILEGLVQIQDADQQTEQ